MSYQILFFYLHRDYNNGLISVLHKRTSLFIDNKKQTKKHVHDKTDTRLAKTRNNMGQRLCFQ